MNRNRIFVVLVVAGVAGFSASAVQAGLIDSTWIGRSNGQWSVAANWDPAVVPNNGGGTLYHATIDFGGAGLVNVDQNATVSRLTLGPQSTLSINPSMVLSIADGEAGTGIVDNRGLLRIESTGSSTELRAAGGTITLTGGGTVLLITSIQNNNSFIRGSGAGGTLINLDNTIRGSGQIGGTGANAIDVVNHGTIRSDDGLSIAGNGPNGFLNHGTVEVIAPSMLGANGNITNTGQFILNSGSTMGLFGLLRQTDGTATINGFLAIINSTVRIEGGEFDVNGEINIPFDGSLLVEGGTFSGNGEIAGPVHNTGGRVVPGSLAAAGNLTVQTYAQSGEGRLTMMVFGEAPIALHDLLSVSQTASLGGQLEPIIDPGFNPVPGTQITFLTAESISGAFDTVSPCSGIRIVYSADSVALEFTGVEKSGDLDCNGAVDVLDLLMLLSAWGACPPSGNCPADLDDSDAVDVLDLLILLANWG